MIPQSARPRLPAIPGEGVGRCPPRLGRIADVEHRQLQAEDTAGGRIDVAADAEEPGGVERLEIGREAGHFELADDLRPGRVGQIDDKQRIDLLERAHVGDVADEPAGIDPLPPGKPLDSADGDEIPVRLPEDKHPRGGIGEVPVAAVAPVRRCHTEKAVVFIERELVERRPRHGPHRHQRHARGAEIEVVDVRRQAGVAGIPPAPPIGSRDVEPGRRGVDRAGDPGHARRRFRPDRVVGDVELDHRQQGGRLEVEGHPGVVNGNELAGSRGARGRGDGVGRQGLILPRLLEPGPVGSRILVDILRCTGGGEVDRREDRRDQPISIGEGHRIGGDRRGWVGRSALHRHERRRGDVEVVLGDDKHAAVDLAGILEPAVEGRLLEDLGRGRIGDVDHGDDDLGLPLEPPAPPAGDPGKRGLRAGFATGTDPGVLLRNDRQPAAAEEQRSLVAVDRDVARHREGSGRPGADDVDAIAGEHIERSAVGLDDIPFVDAGDLVVRAGEVAVACGGRGAQTGGRDIPISDGIRDRPPRCRLPELSPPLLHGGVEIPVLELVVARHSAKRIGALVADQLLAGGEPHLIDPLHAKELVDAGAADERVLPGAAAERVEAGVATDSVVAGAADEGVVAVAPLDPIVTTAAVERVVPRSTLNVVGRVPPLDRVVPRAPHEPGADLCVAGDVDRDRVVAAAPEEMDHAHRRLAARADNSAVDGGPQERGIARVAIDDDRVVEVPLHLVAGDPPQGGADVGRHREAGLERFKHRKESRSRSPWRAAGSPPARHRLGRKSTGGCHGGPRRGKENGNTIPQVG